MSKSRFTDERLAWDGEENEDDIFFTPLESPIKKYANCNVESKQTHLEVHGCVHFYIISQFIELEIDYLNSCALEQSQPKQKEEINAQTKGWVTLTCGMS